MAVLNFHLHVTGPRMRALIALANGEYGPGTNLIVVHGLEREGLVHIETVPSDVEDITLDRPVITERGRTVLSLVEHDVIQYLSKLRPKRPRR